jgi:hypothetical protein
MNRYFVVDDRAVLETLPVKTGIRPSNRWYGASQIYETVTEPYRVEPDAEVHVLVGGTFLVGCDDDGNLVVNEVVFPGERNPYSATRIAAAIRRGTRSRRGSPRTRPRSTRPRR